MTGIAIAFGVTGAIFAVVASCAALMILSLLAMAAALPRGHSPADRLRATASNIPGWALQAAYRLDVWVTVLALIVGAILTVAYS